MSSRPKRDTNAGFIAADDEDLSDASILSDDSDAGPSSRPQRSRRAPKRLEEEQDVEGEGEGAARKRKGLVRGASNKGKGKGRAWEGDFEHTWDNVQEDERGTLEGAVSGALLSGKTRRQVAVARRRREA